MPNLPLHPPKNDLSKVLSKLSRLAWSTDTPSEFSKLHLRAFAASLLYSCAYGVYEKGVVYSTCLTDADEKFLATTGEYGNWATMYLLTFAVVGVASFNRRTMRPSIQEIAVGFFVMMMLEDVSFWVTNKFCGGEFYPLSEGEDWWDTTFTPYRLLGNMGRTISFWPYVPMYYLVMFPPSIAYHAVAFARGPEAARIAAWAISPFMLSIVLTCAVSPPCVDIPDGLSFDERMAWCKSKHRDELYWIPMGVVAFGGWGYACVTKRVFERERASAAQDGDAVVMAMV